MMVDVLDVTYLVVIRLGDSSERREKRGAGNQGKQADSGLGNGVHDSALAYENSVVGIKSQHCIAERSATHYTDVTGVALDETLLTRLATQERLAAAAQIVG
ncbi:hypothetical protein ACLFKT_42720, partial [Paraburkholderia sp. BR14261]